MEKDLQPQNLYRADKYGNSTPLLEDAERRRLSAHGEIQNRMIEIPTVYRVSHSPIQPGGN